MPESLFVSHDDLTEHDEDRCAICLFRMALDSLRLKCSHCFCRACIMLWLKRKRECPVCRKVPGIELSLEDTAPDDGRVYNADGSLVDWTTQDVLQELVESFQSAPHMWDDGDDGENFYTDFPGSFAMFLSPVFRIGGG
jgi:late competence protein required for DNA uptake (superfamily II DNA/RNA helicase)